MDEIVGVRFGRRRLTQGLRKTYSNRFGITSTEFVNGIKNQTMMRRINSNQGANDGVEHAFLLHGLFPFKALAAHQLLGSTEKSEPEDDLF